MAVRPGQGEVRVHDPARDAPRHLPLRLVANVDRPRVVLVGAGHAHAIVLERWAGTARPDADVVVVTEGVTTLYSGMLPGWIAGEYERPDLELDARLMAERAGASLIVGRVARVDAGARVMVLEDDTPIPYDLASLDVGSQMGGPAGMDGARHVSARDPDTIVDVLASGGARAVVVVGGGAAGVELAACARARAPGPVTLMEAGDRLMGGHDPSVSDRVHKALERRSVSVRLKTPFSGATGGPSVGEASPGDTLIIWATGARGPALLAESGLPLDDGGFVRVDGTLAVVGHEGLFAAGDCASRETDPAPKAGFHAIEQGEALATHLAACAAAWPARPSGLQDYTPSSDFLTLLNLGDGRALGTKWGLTVAGRWVRTLKDVIDRSFVRRFQRQPTRAGHRPAG